MSEQIELEIKKGNKSCNQVQVFSIDRKIQQVQIAQDDLQKIDHNVDVNSKVKENSSASSKMRICKKIAIVILVIFLFFVLTNHSKKQQEQKIQKIQIRQILQKEDNLPESIQQKKQHPMISPPKPQIVALDIAYSREVEKAYHAPFDNNKNQQVFYKQNIALRCSQYLPYNVLSTQQAEYYRWYGKVGKSLKGTNYQPGHLFERHLAVNESCTPQQKKDKKTVFLNKTQLFIALSRVSFLCDLHNHTKFQFSQNGINQYKIKGIDCSTGQKKQFDKYFILFKRAVRNSYPTQEEYMTAMYTTLWTFYPSR